MFAFIDGQPVILDFQQVEQLYYQAFVAEFGAISITQWRGSYEYQCLYPAIQLMVENGTITQEAINESLQTIANINEEIKRPAVLHSRVAERFAEAGYIATIRVADINTKGIVAICVDYPATPTTRVLTVGTDGLVFFGVNVGVYGSLDNVQFDGDLIKELSVNSDYAIPNRIFTDSLSPFPRYITDLSVNFSGFGDVIFTWNGTTDRYENSDNALADFIVANDTLDIDFVIENEVTTDPAQDTEISELIVNEMLPAGQHMIGNVSQAVVISNGQSVLAQWSTPIQNDVEFFITLTVDKNSSYPVDTVDDIVIKFLDNFNAQNQLGQDITPATYYQIGRDAPWASEITTSYTLNGGLETTDIYYANYTDKFNAVLQPVNVIIITV